MNNSNSSYVRNCFPKSPLYLVLLSLGLSFCGSAQSSNWTNQINLPFQRPDSLENSIRELIDQYPDKAIIGTFQALEIPISTSALEETEGKFNLGRNDFPSYWYLSSELSSEDRLIGNESGDLFRGQKEILLGPLYKEVQLEILDLPPYGNSSVSIDGRIIARKDLAEFGDAGPCQINPFCVDSLNPLIDAAVHILWINSNLAGFCSGTLMNNTAGDYKGYILSAEHCALTPSFTSGFDFDRWAFTFNYHSSSCQNPATPNGINKDRLIGASLIAHSDDNGGDFGSDFLLMELNEPIPLNFDAYWAGWNRSAINPLSGQCLHFPAGDIMKLSTYRRRLEAGTFGDIDQETHWLVEWSANSGGYGSTEPGSSGSAIYDQQQLVSGTLTGGSSSCEKPDALDYFGSFYYHWDLNGNVPSQQLKPWLDPLNSQTLALGGMRRGDSLSPPTTSQWTLGPNPIQKNQVKFSGYTNLSATIEVRWLSLDGRSRNERYFPAYFEKELIIPFPFRESGLYFLEITQAGQMTRYKIIKP